MRAVSVSVYAFDDLSDKAKETARSWFREHAEFICDGVLEEATLFGSCMGFDIDRILYSGFCSQGDGACFEGTWESGACTTERMASLHKHAPHDAELHRIAKELHAISRAYPEARMTVVHQDCYYHEGSTHFDINLYWDDEELDLELAAGDDGIIVYDTMHQAAKETLVDLSRDLMRWIYDQLEAEYDYHNSDEQIDENIRINEYEFDEDGRLFTA